MVLEPILTVPFIPPVTETVIFAGMEAPDFQNTPPPPPPPGPVQSLTRLLALVPRAPFAVTVRFPVTVIALINTVPPAPPPPPPSPSACVGSRQMAFTGDTPLAFKVAPGVTIELAIRR